MATLYVTEFAGVGGDNQGATVGVLAQPPVAEQTVAIGGGSLASAAFNALTTFVRLHSDVICSVEFGAAPTASATTARMAAGQTEYFHVVAGQKVAVITNA